MTAKLLPEPERWSERAAGGGPSAEDAIGGSLRRIKAATEPSAATTARWAQHAMGAGPRPPAATRVWSIAIVAAILGGASVVAASVAWRAVVQHAPAPGSEGDPSQVARKHRAKMARQEAAPAAVDTTRPVETPAPAVIETPPAAAPAAPLPPALAAPLPAAAKAPSPTAPVATPAAAPVTSPTEVAQFAVATPQPAPVPALPAATRSLHPATRTPAPPVSVTPVFEPAPLAASEASRAATPAASDEALLVARAFRRLRNEGDARGALAALDERERRFGAGAFETEAALARAEALVLLDRGDKALPILLGIRDPHAGLTPEVRVTRAELLARAKRCDEAMTDFELVLATGAPPATRERALYGRASCRLQGPAPDRARPDLEQYLVEYPDGRFAPVVRAALNRLHGP